MALEVDFFKTAKQSNIKSLQYAFRDRKNRKRAFRSLWISLELMLASSELGISYSKLINGMNKNNIIIDRKILGRYCCSRSINF